MSTELGAGDMREPLRHIFSNIYVECCVKNPLWKPDDEEISCAAFADTLDRYVATL